VQECSAVNFFFTVFSLSSFKGKIGNKKSFVGTGEMLWGSGRSPLHHLFAWAKTMMIALISGFLFSSVDNVNFQYNSH